MLQGSGNTRAATGKRQRPGSSPDFNPAEDLGAIIKDRVEDRMLNEKGRGRYSRHTLLSNLQTVLHDLEHDSKLFAELLLSFQHRLDAVVAAAGGHTDY